MESRPSVQWHSVFLSIVPYLPLFFSLSNWRRRQIECLQVCETFSLTRRKCQKILVTSITVDLRQKILSYKYTNSKGGVVFWHSYSQLTRCCSGVLEKVDMTVWTTGRLARKQCGSYYVRWKCRNQSCRDHRIPIFQEILFHSYRAYSYNQCMNQQTYSPKYNTSRV